MAVHSQPYEDLALISTKATSLPFWVTTELARQLHCELPAVTPRPSVPHLSRAGSLGVGVPGVQWKRELGLVQTHSKQTIWVPPSPSLSCKKKGTHAPVCWHGIQQAPCK